MSVLTFDARPYRRAFDLDRIKQVGAEDVAAKLGLIRPSRDRTRYAWADEGPEHSGAIQFNNDGTYYDHKNSQGGSCIDLVMQWMERGVHSATSSPFVAACLLIAEGLGLWLDTADLQRRARRLAKQASSSDRLLAMAQKPRSTMRFEEARRFAEAVGFDIDRLTLAVLPGDNGTFSFSPAAPYFAGPVATKTDGTPGGWSSAELEGHLEGRLHFVDFDGLPALASIERLRAELRSRGLPVAVVAISSFADEHDRVKAHFYFRDDTAPPDRDAYMARKQFLHSVIEELVGGWNDVPRDERDRMAMDPACSQYTRLARLPGFAKRSGQHAVVVLHADGAVADLAELLATRPQTVNAGHYEYLLGASCTVTIAPKKESDEPITVPVARHVYPLMCAERVENGESSVLIRYRTRGGASRECTVSLGAAQNKRRAEKTAEELADMGVQLCPGNGHHLIFALAHWANQAQSTLGSVVERPGWHGRPPGAAYVNGANVAGARWRYLGDDLRSERSGTLQTWQQQVLLLVRTPLLRFLLGLSLAAALVRPTRRSSFTLHIHQASSRGKTTAAHAAFSVWSDPMRASTWQGTLLELEVSFVRHNDALFVFDEMKDAAPEVVAKVAHVYADGQGKGRGRRDGSAKERRRWSGIGLSTGEIAAADYVGIGWQGGQAVRMIDLALDHGDLTESAKHAIDLDAACKENFGAAGDAWVGYLVSLDEGDWALLRRDLAEAESSLRQNAHDPEGGRIVASLAIVEIALRHGVSSGVLPSDWAATTRGDLEYVAARVLSGRAGGTNPEARAWRELMGLRETQPARFPKVDDYEKGTRDVVGVRDYDSLKTTVGMLDQSGVVREAGTTGRRLLDWLVGKGLAVQQSHRTRVGDHLGRWWTIKMDASDE